MLISGQRDLAFVAVSLCNLQMTKSDEVTTRNIQDYSDCAFGEAFCLSAQDQLQDLVCHVS